ncbi:hypothetical protein RvY_02212 [Ramazzottius varieornatus]|uniref:Uncharacterized protein n=1 Tax=Ramazzottius varieornatus TaxID=947166 RepID=A0A1D1UMP9_RAMVA|nr:hypothetical protein RvY_02212 [Ramazzottius varieornatus]
MKLAREWKPSASQTRASSNGFPSRHRCGFPKSLLKTFPKSCTEWW